MIGYNTYYPMVLSLYCVCIKKVEPLQINCYRGHCAALEELKMRTQFSCAKNLKIAWLCQPKSAYPWNTHSMAGKNTSSSSQPFKAAACLQAHWFLSSLV